mgnify:CR=1 FL=1
MKTYTIIGGVNGVGKSSLTGVLRSELTDLGSVIDVDKLTASLGGDKLAGGKAAIRKIESCLQKGVHPGRQRGRVSDPPVLCGVGQHPREPCPHPQPGGQGRPQHPRRGRAAPV